MTFLHLDASAPYINNFLESNDSTTLGMNFITRMIAKVVQPLSIVLDIRSTIEKMKQTKSDLGWLPLEGMPAFEDDWSDSIKLVNNLFGFEPARPLGPLVELVGPIMSDSYPDLTPQIQTFLDNHKKIAYVAFGQSAKIESEEIKLILIALMDSIERRALDGFVWATRDSVDRFPQEIITSTKTVYYLSNMSTCALFLDWAPQMAILSHPSTQVFISHGGLGSLHESMYAGVRTALYPFYGDQPSNSYMMRTQHLGVQLNYNMKQAEVSYLLEKVSIDKDGAIQSNVNRFKAMIQIHSKHGVLRGADIVEEVIFGGVDGLLPHRYEVSREMSFIKSFNLDIAAFLLLVSLSFVGFVLYTIVYVIGIIKKLTKMTNHEIKLQGGGQKNKDL